MISKRNLKKVVPDEVMISKTTLPSAGPTPQHSNKDIERANSSQTISMFQVQNQPMRGTRVVLKNGQERKINIIKQQ